MTDALETNYLNYPTFNDFFTRALKPDARPIINKHNIIISPVDGVVWQIGKIDKNQLVYAKGRIFSLEQLLADSKEAFSFHHSNFVVLYLAPHNYHRFHMPLTGKLRSMRYIPGKLFSVSPKIAENIPDLFAKNERIVTVFDTFIGPMAMIFVGAIIVGSIETKWEGTITPNKTNNLINWNYSNRNIIFERGAEIGNFKLGSTVILLLPSKTTEWKDDLKANISIKMGQSLGKTLLNL
ncbi:MAG: archaetidylserine decarboxylase [Coxiellaceae bacterium]|jgi:phosphatidylserine decarboxylase|nr:archaetidylserine decarboxylase [Coxiellaceae bacterium]